MSSTLNLHSIQRMQPFKGASVPKRERKRSKPNLFRQKLSNRKVVYLNRETQERADFIVRRLGDRGSNLSSFVESIVRLHLEEYGEDIEKWRRL